ncbi:MAG TPA: DUF3810 domain-containing protein [Pyrinomonadaceae bacterium]
MDDEVNPNSSPKPTPAARLRGCWEAFLRLLPKARRELGTPLAFLLSAVLLQLLAALFPALTERVYARTIYPSIVSALSSFSRRFVFSTGEVLACLLLFVILASVIRLGLLLYLRPAGRVRRIVVSTRFALWFAGACLWVFLLCFGLNYHRPLLFELLGFERREATAAELEAISSEVIGRINESYLEAHADGRAAPGREEIIRLLSESYLSVPELSLLPRGSFAPPKPVYFSELLTRFGISGVYFPFTAEPNYNEEMPDFQLPFTIAHEMAHQRGVARESEANFVAFMVCVNSSDPFVRYSGYRNGVGVVSELFRVNPEKARELVRQLGPGYREDSRRAILFWTKAGGVFGNLGLRLNDLYLRANFVKSGTADYARSTTLIIGYYLRTFGRG